MLSDPAAERARRRIVGLAASGLDATALLGAAAAEVQTVVAYDGAVWATVDPETTIITGAVVQELPRESAAAFYENEYGHEDVNAFARLARGLRPVATASEATGGHLERSRLHREVGRAFGFLGDELRAAFTVGGSCWGVVSLGRRSPTPHFRQADVSFLASIAGPLAEGLRRAVLVDALQAPAARPARRPWSCSTRPERSWRPARRRGPGWRSSPWTTAWDATARRPRCAPWPRERATGGRPARARPFRSARGCVPRAGAGW